MRLFPFVINIFLDFHAVLCLRSFTGSKQSYGEPQDLTEIVREALKDKKPIAEKSSTEPPSAEDEKETTETRHEAKSKN